MKDSIEELMKELEDNGGLLEIKSLSKYRKNGIVIDIKKANTGFVYDRILLLKDGTEVIAWI